MSSTVSDPTTIVLIAITVQVAFCLIGLTLILLYWRHRNRSAALPRWPVSGTAFVAAAAFTLATGIVIQEALVRTLGMQSDTLWQLLVPGGAFQIGILTGAILAAQLWLRTPTVAAAAAPSRKPIVQSLKVFVIVIPITYAASLLWMNGLHALGIDAPRQELINLFAKGSAPGPFFALTFVAVILAPLTEEIVFRGGLFRFLYSGAPLWMALAVPVLGYAVMEQTVLSMLPLAGLGGLLFFRNTFVGRLHRPTPRWIALILPAAVFAALHVNLASFFPLLVLGVLFSLAYERTGRLIVPIVAHALFNLNTILLVLCGAST